MVNTSRYEFDPSKDLLDMKGKVVIVTGGNGGIGLETVRLLARAGAKVYLAARNQGRAEACLERVKREGLEPGNGEVIWLKLDLSDPRDAKKSAEDFLARESRLDVLVNNAGMLSSPHTIGPDGVSTLATVNYVGPYVFTRTLLPLLQQTAKESNSDVRIVNVSSMTHKNVPTAVKFDDINDFNINFGGFMPGLMCYAHSKLMLTIWSTTLQRKLNEDPSAPITVIAVHPGAIDTFSHKLPLAFVFKFLIGFFMAPPSIGAYTPAFAAAGKRVAESRATYQGVYLENVPTGQITEPHKAVLDEEIGEALWKTTESFLEHIDV
ncbi:hypothetical protein NLJ89_g8230 [Agrocybe chaxingu]|uniref:NAD-P-binding protein n=1 Tax=Agrocybe chaxingu TaxID=84603 RepID=A0A9W8MSY4_9AGAR|nr:hypothetical protein NLJ89_g8230 [Agrocybe chaxingu]